MKKIIRRLLKKEKNDGNQIVTQPSYRDQLAANLQTFKSFGDEGKRLAEIFLMEQENTEEYLGSLGEKEKIGKDKLKQLIRRGSDDAHSLFLEHIDKFEYDDEILLDMIEYSDYSWVTDTIKRNWHKFKIKKYEDILIEACDRKWRDRSFVEFILEKGEGFTEKTIDKLIKHYHEDLIIKYLEKFGGVSHQKIVNKLIESRHGEVVGKYLERFEGVSHQEIVNKLIETKQGKIVGKYLEKFEGVSHQEIVNKLIETKQGDVVMLYLEEFKGVSHKEIVNKLIETGQGNIVLDCKEKFQLTEEDWTKPMNRLSKCLEFGDILYNIGKFPGSMHQDIINRVDVNDKDLLERLHRSIGCVVCQLSTELAEKFCDFGWIWLVVKNIAKFKRFNVKIAEMFIRAGYHDIVLEDPEKFGLKNE